MKTAIVVLVLITCAATLSGTAAARNPDAPLAAATAGGPDRHPGHDTVWSQGPASGLLGVASQFAPDYPFYAETATDFFAFDDADVNHLHWWGRWFPPPRDGRPMLSLEPVSWNGSSRALDCTDAILSGCNMVVTGDNTGGPTNVEYYSCSGWSETGPEVVYELVIPFSPTTVTVALSDMTADLDIFLLSDCHESTCITYGDYSFTVALDAGIYYLVVDGYHGATGTYTLTVECLEVPPLYFCARFYEHSVDEPGAMLYEHYFSDYSETWNEDLQTFAYWADIAPFFIADGQFYWVSIQSVLNHGDFGQWYWQESDSAVLEWAVMDFEILGIPRWTPLPDAIGKTVDMSIELAAIDTPVEARSWGSIKALYR